MDFSLFNIVSTLCGPFFMGGSDRKISFCNIKQIAIYCMVWTHGSCNTVKIRLGLSHRPEFKRTRGIGSWK